MLSKIYVGWDSREDIAYQVCRHSLNNRTSAQVIPLKLNELIAKGLYTRNYTTDPLTGQKTDLVDGRPFSTEFSFSRFLVPKLMNYQGWALFVDCDFLFLSSLNELEQYMNPEHAVVCVHHNYQPKETMKMDGVKQEKYFRKNWSSFVLWNCSHPANQFLTPEVVNSQTGSWLHKFGWLEDHMIGSLPEEWNWLEGHSSRSINPKAIHYTRGGPWFDNYKNVEYAELWNQELELYKSLNQGTCLET